jgi:hypothetical protein
MGHKLLHNFTSSFVTTKILLMLKEFMLIQSRKISDIMEGFSFVTFISFSNLTPEVTMIRIDRVVTSYT